MDVKVLAVFGYMFYGSCRKISRVLSPALEPISIISSKVRVGSESSYRFWGITGSGSFLWEE